MTKTTQDIMEELKMPFPVQSISWRAGATNAKKNGGKPSKCIALAYIDARDVMNRLDEVFGFNWNAKYSHADKKTICEISVLIDGQWITRANGAGDSDIEAEKGAISDAFKRAAVMFGIGRYLYDLPNEWVDCDEWGHILKPPSLPDWAKPKAKKLPKLTDEEAQQAFNNWDNLKKTLLADDGKIDNDKVTEEWGKLQSNVRSAIKAHAELLKAKQAEAELQNNHIKDIAKEN